MTEIKFANPLEWSKANAYESHTVVFVPSTRSTYTSRKAVPENSIDITNTDYWTQTGNISSQVSALQTIVNNNKSDADKKFAGTTSTTLLTKINGNATNITNNKNDVDKKFAAETSTALLTKINSNASDLENVKLTLYTPTS